MTRLYRIILVMCLLFSATAAAANTTLRIKIDGLNGAALKNVQARLAIVQQSYGNELTPTERLEFYHLAPTNIRQALEPYGYFKARIVHQQLTRVANEWEAYFNVAPGPEVRIQQVELVLTGPGKQDPVIQKYFANFPIKRGQPLATEAYEQAKNSLLETANNQGYIKAVFTKKIIRINLFKNTATIILHLNTGPRFYFGTLTFNSNPFTTEFLKRYLPVPENAPFSSQALLKLQENLSKSHYFQQVIVTPKLTQIKNFKVPVEVNLIVPKPKKYNLGIGYGTFTGPRITLGAEYRRIGQTGQHFTSQIRLSTVVKGLAAKYYIPGNNPLTDEYTLGADAQKLAAKNGQSFSETLSAAYIKNIHAWQNTLSLNYLIERYQVDPGPSYVSRLFYPSYSVTRIQADNLLSPRKGSSINFTVRGANERILATTGFIQTELKGKYIMSPTQNSRIILRGDIGYSVVQNLARLPLTLRFLAGGLGSVRGYDYSSIGPGRYLKIVSAEVQHRIYGNFSGALFYDAGTATNHFNAPLLRGAGIGGVYNSIIGPMQIYAARALSKPGKPFSIELSIGPDF